MIFEEITCKTPLNVIKNPHLSYKRDLNIYRGCQHGCKYCFALYTHRYLESKDYFNTIFVKTNIVEELEKVLRRKNWDRPIINIGGVTDSYQQCEAEYKLMPQILELMIKYKNPCIISTKSKLILRDYDLIEKLADVTSVNIAATITAMNEDIRQKLEPMGATSLERFEVLNAFSNTKASRGLHVMPLIPHLTDDDENIESLCENGVKNKVSYILMSGLNLKGETRRVFFDFIRKEYPERFEHIAKVFNGSAYSDREYRREMFTRANKIRIKHGLSANYMAHMTKRLKELEKNEGQISLFDLMN